jgi:uncharacterized membrane protein YsdA (DUF1294 family)/cold shock CspA family protein
MRKQGKITQWKDSQGFGFIEPDGGGARVFVHQSAFINRQRRPAEGVAVVFETSNDERGRPRAEKVAFAIDAKANQPVRKPTRTISSDNKPVRLGRLDVSSLAVLCAVLAIATITGRLPAWLPLWYLGVSVVTFFVYAQDKSAAQSGQWRTPESTLHLLGLIGGWPGGLLAQKAFRHKSSKREFQLTFWASVVANGGCLCWLLSSKGKPFLQHLF